MKYTTLVLASILSFVLSTGTQADESQHYQDNQDAVVEIARSLALSTIVVKYCSQSRDDMEVALAKDLELQTLRVATAFEQSTMIFDTTKQDVSAQFGVWSEKYKKHIFGSRWWQASLCKIKTFDTIHSRLASVADLILLKA